jgi:hypothetical protein
MTQKPLRLDLMLFQVGQYAACPLAGSEVLE